MAPFRNRSIAACGGWLLVCAVVLLALSPIVSIAQDATPVPGDAPIVDAAPSPTPEPSPTPLPPTLAPTSDPTPLPTFEPTATPTSEPTLAPTPVPSMDTPAGGMAIQSIDTAEGIACQQISAGDEVVAAGEHVVFRCDNGPSDQLKPNGTLNFYLKVHAVTPGWQLHVAFGAEPAGGPTSNPTGWQASPPTPSDLLHSGFGTTHAYFALGPAPDAVATGEGTASIQYLQGRDHQTPGASYAPPRTAALGATYGTPTPPGSCLPSISAGTIDFGTSTSTGTVYTPVQATVALTITAGAGCSGLPDTWRIQASTQGYTRSGGGGTIPATAVAYGGPSGAAPSGLTPSVPVSLAGNAQTIATGNAELTSGASWNATFTLTPPPDAPPGTYTGTITFDIAAGG